MIKLFKTPNVFKRMSRHSLDGESLRTARRSTNVLDMWSIPDEDNTPIGLCCQCEEKKEYEKIIICRCQHMFHSSCVYNVLDCSSDIIKNTKCPNCGINLDISDMMMIYADICTRSNNEIIKNDVRIQEVEKRIEQFQKEFILCKKSVNQISQQRDTSKRIISNVVAMIS